MKKVFYPKGVCSTRYDIDIEDGIIKNISVTGGCNGNLKGICSLIKGRRAEDVIPLMRGIQCGYKGTSCPDQISFALEEAVKEEALLKESSKKGA